MPVPDMRYLTSHRRRTIQSNPKQAAVYAYLAGGTSGIISNWLETGTQEPPQQVAELIQSLNETVLTVLVPLKFSNFLQPCNLISNRLMERSGLVAKIFFALRSRKHYFLTDYKSCIL